ncbi:50S ribosomal protein L6 [Acidobacteria bacterium AH-259-G07]|nr:50S ribosomal protein L6 [Acidobacteria bacterium AH-259-G07]
MSRVGRRKIKIPSGVQVSIQKDRVRVEGPRGKLETPLPSRIKAELADGVLVTHRENDEKKLKALHGLTSSLLGNAVTGVTEGFRKELDVVGIGYRANVEGKSLNLGLGFSHPLEFPVPEGIEIKIERTRKSTANYVASIVISGNDKQRVGQVAADIRALRPPDPYKGKGIRYADEVVRLKVGKKGA